MPTQDLYRVNPCPRYTQDCRDLDKHKIFSWASLRLKYGVFSIILGSSTLYILSSFAHSFSSLFKIVLTVDCAISFTSSQDSMNAISASKETTSVKCLVVTEGSALNTLFTEKTRSNADITICL